jgi:hypothetical protein
VTEEDYREQIGYSAPRDPSHQVVYALDVTDDADPTPDVSASPTLAQLSF